MRLVTDFGEERAHPEFLNNNSGAYEWWYFDAISDCNEWSIVCIWFLGNPFSPYYRQSIVQHYSDPFTYNAVYFALYRFGQLYSYHFTQFPRSCIQITNILPLNLVFGPSCLTSNSNGYLLTIIDENANRHRLSARLQFSSPTLVLKAAANSEITDSHYWLPAAPACCVRADISVSSLQDDLPKTVHFSGQGYHDHNWGVLPFEPNLDNWYWMRSSWNANEAVVGFYERGIDNSSQATLLYFRKGELILKDQCGIVTLTRNRRNVFGLNYATIVNFIGAEFSAQFHLFKRLDSAPFYMRTLCRTDTHIFGNRHTGNGFAEYFRPGMLRLPIVSSATKARLVIANE